MSDTRLSRKRRRHRAGIERHPSSGIFGERTDIACGLTRYSKNCSPSNRPNVIAGVTSIPLV